MIKQIAILGITLGILLVGTDVNHWESINKVSSEFDMKDSDFEFLEVLIRPCFWIIGRFADIGIELGNYLYPHHHTTILLLLGLSLIGFTLPSILTTIFIIYFLIKERKQIWHDFKQRKYRT